MEELVVKVMMPEPRLESEIRDLIGGTMIGSAPFESSDIFARIDGAGRLLGVACAVESEKYCHLLIVTVHPGARGQGTGSMLVNHLLSYYAGTCDAMYLVAEEEGFFERFGFQSIPFEGLPEDIRSRVVRERAATPRAVAMRIELPGDWTRK